MNKATDLHTKNCPDFADRKATKLKGLALNENKYLNGIFLRDALARPWQRGCCIGAKQFRKNVLANRSAC